MINNTQAHLEMRSEKKCEFAKISEFAKIPPLLNKKTKINITLLKCVISVIFRKQLDGSSDTEFPCEQVKSTEVIDS